MAALICSALADNSLAKMWVMFIASQIRSKQAGENKEICSICHPNGFTGRLHHLGQWVQQCAVFVENLVNVFVERGAWLRQNRGYCFQIGDRAQIAPIV